MTLPDPSQIIKAIIRTVPHIAPYLSDDTIKAAGYDGVRTVLHGAVFGAVFGYLSGGSLADMRSRMELAVSRAYVETSEIAYQDGGGELPLDPDTAAWARGQLDAQLAYVDELFEHLKDIRREGDFDAGAIAEARASGYAGGLDGFYNEAKMHGAKNIMLTWHLGNTEKHCKTCASLDGKSHRASWYIERDYIPRKPGANLDCHGYNCDCTLTDKNGNEYTI